MDRPPIRWRGGEEAVTAADLICPEEVAEAAVWVIQHELGATGRFARRCDSHHGIQTNWSAVGGSRSRRRPARS